MKLSRIGILTGGGDCPGLNAVIRSVAKPAMAHFNEKVIGMTDAAFDQALKEEIRLLESMRNSISGDSGGAKYWKDSLGVDIQNTKQLL